jgi:hypothetical protein
MSDDEIRDLEEDEKEGDEAFDPDALDEEDELVDGFEDEVADAF